MVLTLFLAVPLAACASGGTGDFPSLAKRPIETRFAVAESVPLAAPGPLSADLVGRLARWRDQAAAAESAFAAAIPGAERAVAAAARAPVASEVWITAQQALSRLAITRGPVADALGDVDALYIARQDSEAIDGLPDIVVLRDALAAAHQQQNDRIAALAARLAN